MTRAVAVALVALVALLALALAPRSARAADAGDEACVEGAACGLDDAGAGEAPTPPRESGATLLFFWGVGCPHCEEARPVVEALARENPTFVVESIEVRRDPEGRRRFVATMDRLGAAAVGVPTFVLGDAYVVGYSKGETDRELRALVARGTAARTAHDDAGSVVVPWLGRVDPRAVSLPTLTLTIGLADGLNPCAMWVLVVLLGILLHVDSTKRMLLYAGTFVVMSGVVYFLFMVAWSALFSLVGMSRVVTMILGGALVVMGLVNLKEIFWFKKGPSLVIPDKVKPGLFRRMRAIAGAASTPVAIAGIATLAFFVNLIELGCTLGLPAVYTRILSLRGLGTTARLGYLALYNVAYVVPLLVVVIVFVAVRRKLAVTERAARVLKGVSGALLTLFGALFLLAPELVAG